MELALIEQLESAIEHGELLTVVYFGGHAPGTKRRILPIRLAGPILYARSAQSMFVKSYLVQKLSVVSDDHPVPWLIETSERLRATKIDPKGHFSEWAYEIDRALWPALGVTLREYVVKQEKGSLEQASGSPLNEDRLGNRAPKKYLAYAIGNPPQFDFQEGDLFYPKNSDNFPLQIVAKRKLLEVHQITRDLENPRIAFQLVDEELIQWLRAGEIPRHARIDAAMSFSEVLRYSIRSERKDTGP